MKFKFNLLLAFMILFSVAAYCQSAKSALLIGTWKLESLKPHFPDTFSDKDKSKGEKIIAGDEAEFKKTGFIFSKDMVTVGKKKFGYVMNAEGTEVAVKKNNKTAFKATIIELTSDRLVFTRPDDGMTVTYTLVK